MRTPRLLRLGWSVGIVILFTISVVLGSSAELPSPRWIEKATGEFPFLAVHANCGGSKSEPVMLVFADGRVLWSVEYFAREGQEPLPPPTFMNLIDANTERARERRIEIARIVNTMDPPSSDSLRLAQEAIRQHPVLSRDVGRIVLREGVLPREFVDALPMLLEERGYLRQESDGFQFVHGGTCSLGILYRDGESVHSLYGTYENYYSPESNFMETTFEHEPTAFDQEKWARLVGALLSITDEVSEITREFVDPAEFEYDTRWGWTPPERRPTSATDD